MFFFLLFRPPRYKMLLDEEGRRRYDRRYPRAALRTYKYASFQHLYESRCDQALLNAMWHDFMSFNNLLKLFAPFYYYHTFDQEGNGSSIRKKN